MSSPLRQSQFEQPLPCNEAWRGSVPISNTPFARRFRGEREANCDTRESSDWLRDYLSRYQAKDISNTVGCSTRAAENVKQGRNGFTMAHLVTMCRNDPTFRADFFKFCGGHLEGEPEMVAALSKAINAVMRRNSFGPTRVAERASVDASAADPLGQSGSTARDNLERGS